MAAGSHQFALTRKYLENIRRHTTAEELLSNMLHTRFSDINLTPPLKKKGKNKKIKKQQDFIVFTLQYSEVRYPEQCSSTKEFDQ